MSDDAMCRNVFGSTAPDDGDGLEIQGKYHFPACCPRFHFWGYVTRDSPPLSFSEEDGDPCLSF